ncbi:HET-domain-containing protein [Periconia macrospinosa]|uniref:HET-domain-containing protein n=1 Tax=Periconia macrospinosa TaxID=97972 RepID=A0A2V1DX67_9PLEO|nr:HET-domain-containing protein [Periconia macrospinosa]
MSLVHITRTFSVRLCTFCQVVVSRELECFKFRHGTIYYPERDHISMKKSLRKREECALCDYVIEMLKLRGSDIGDEERNGRIINGICLPIEESDTSYNRGQLKLSIGFASSLTVNLSCLLIGPTSNPPEFPLWNNGKSVGMSDRLWLPKNWLADCQTDHPRCKDLEKSLPVFCPTRLIDVSTQTPHLVCLPQNTKAPYAALSHCWGKLQIIVTKQGNLTSHMQEIPLNSMPRTFQDAIAITRCLGLQYIWIDSLCIIQDSPSDWEYEAARMASVYTGATFTIAATWGHNGQCGCFHDAVPPLVIEIHETTNPFAAHNAQFAQRLHFRPLPNANMYLKKAALNSRAWTLQEIVLSRRTILFAEDMIYWHCTSLHQSEDGLITIEDVADSALALPSLGPVVRHDTKARDLLYESWQVSMKEYSARNITMSTDKLAALAGITEMFKNAVGDDPLVGLWKKDIGRGLMWGVPIGRHGMVDSQVVEKLNVPSWSWTKIRGEVDLSVADTELVVEIEDARVEWNGLPMTSSIHHACIKGRGIFIRILEVEKEKDEGCLCIGARYVTTEDPADGSESKFKVYWRMDECKLEKVEEMSFLLIRLNQVRDLRRSDPSVMEMAALVVLPIENRGPEPVYRRIGMGDIVRFPQKFFEKIAPRDFTLV